MKTHKYWLILFMIAGVNSIYAQINNGNIMPPKAEKIPKALTIHGNTRTDNYY